MIQGRVILIESNGSELKLLDENTGRVSSMLSLDVASVAGMEASMKDEADGKRDGKKKKEDKKDKDSHKTNHKKKGEEGSRAIFDIEWWTPDMQQVRKNGSNGNGTGGTVDAKAEKAAGAGVLAVSTSDKQVTLWGVAEKESGHHSHFGSGASKFAKAEEPAWVMRNALQAPVAQTKLCWCEAAQMLASAGTDYVIYLWEITIGDGMGGRIVHQLIGHTDIVMDLVELPRHGLLVSASLDKRLHLWETKRGRDVGVLHGHTRGVS